MIISVIYQYKLTKREELVTKFTEAKHESAIIELLGEEGYSYACLSG